MQKLIIFNTIISILTIIRWWNELTREEEEEEEKEYLIYERY